MLVRLLYMILFFFLLYLAYILYIFYTCDLIQKIYILNNAAFLGL